MHSDKNDLEKISFCFFFLISAKDQFSYLPLSPQERLPAESLDDTQSASWEYPYLLWGTRSRSGEHP